MGIPAFAAGGAPPAPQRFCATGVSAPAFPRISRCRRAVGPWQNPPAPGCGGGGIRPPEAVFAGASARICAHFLSKIYGNLSKNPVNLPEFIEFYRNSVFSNGANRLHHHTGIPRVRADGQLRANAPSFRPRRKGVEGEFFAMPGERGPTGGLSSISRGDENPATPNAGKYGIGRDR